MSDKDYYPMGACNDESAPYNEPEFEPKEFVVKVYLTLEKAVTLSTNDYIEETWKDVETDEDGYPCVVGGRDISTSMVDWDKEFDEQCPNLLFLLKDLQKYYLADIKKLNALPQTNENKKRIKQLQEKIDFCDWNFSDQYIEEI